MNGREKAMGPRAWRVVGVEADLRPSKIHACGRA